MNIKNLALVLASATGLYAGSSLAATHELASSVASGIDLPYNVVKTYHTSNWFYSESLSCKVRIARGEQNKGNKIVITALKKRVIVNGLILEEKNNTPSSTTVVLNKNNTITFELVPGATMTLTNIDAPIVNLTCS